jgi:hypothetical protein
MYKVQSLEDFKVAASINDDVRSISFHSFTGYFAARLAGACLPGLGVGEQLIQAVRQDYIQQMPGYFRVAC